MMEIISVVFDKIEFIIKYFIRFFSGLIDSRSSQSKRISW